MRVDVVMGGGGFVRSLLFYWLFFILDIFVASLSVVFVFFFVGLFFFSIIVLHETKNVFFLLYGSNIIYRF